MKESDLDKILEIEKLSFITPWSRDNFSSEIVAPFSFPHVAVSGGEIYGYICFTALFEQAEILVVAVHPAHRGKGLAGMMIRHALQCVRQKGAETLGLEVRSDNSSAISLYQSLGFLKSGIRLRYYEDGEDAVLMEISLKETV